MFGLFKSLVKNDAFENLDPKDFLAKSATMPDAVLLDVRTPGEFASGTLDNAMNLDYFGPKFSEQVAKLDKSKAYFVFCRSGQRSANACRTMHGLGFGQLYNMAGGVIALDR